MFLALIEPATYLDFIRPVPFSGPEGPIERGVLNEGGAISGRAQAAVRPLSAADFARIVSAGLPESDIVLPRVDDAEEATMLQELRAPYTIERPIIERLIAKPERKAFFRRAVLQAPFVCALKRRAPGIRPAWLPRISSGGRSALRSARRRPEQRWPLAVRRGRALAPHRLALRPHPAFLALHRANCFKH